jgi:manganese/iron transport system permease protein/iron/zinc/copper transport system permease protein
MFGIAAVTLLTANLLMRPLLLTLFEPNVAAAQGVPVRCMQYLVFALLALSLVASLQAVGCVLSVGLLVAPAATMSLITNRTSLLFWGGGLLGAGGAVGGVLLASQLNLSAGPTIVMLLGAGFLAAWLFSPRYGLLTATHR